MRCAMVACAGAMLFAALPASGQLEGKTALSYDPVLSQQISRSAARALGMATVSATQESTYVARLTNETWDLVILDVPNREIVDKPTVLTLFEQHLARGGRLMVNYPELDQWPELQALLEVRTTRDRDRPAWLYPPPIGNPIWGGTSLISPEDDLWPDNGDSLMPMHEAYVLARFDSRTGDPASIIRRDKLAVANGFDWDSLVFGGAYSLAQREILYLLGCRPDMEPDGHLDIFDFLEFQDRWVTGIRTANWDFDDTFSIFDFIEFQNDFAAGCP